MTKKEYDKIRYANRKKTDPELLKRRRQTDRALRRKYRETFIQMYGAQCKCCAEKTHEFLTLDHINNDGNKERGTRNTCNRKAYKNAVKNYQPNRYQILCFNCNNAKSIYGQCPHKNNEPLKRGSDSYGVSTKVERRS